MTEVEDGIFKGSGRSFGEFNLAEALSFAKDTILGGGGHAAAAGVQVAREHLDEFKGKINQYYKSLNLKNQERFMHCQADLVVTGLNDFSLDLLDNLSLLEPFGPMNEEPVFCLKDANILEMRRMGSDGAHLRLDLRGRDGGTVKSVAFSAPESWFKLDDATSHTFLIQPTANEWNGARSIEARLIDVLD